MLIADILPSPRRIRLIFSISDLDAEHEEVLAEEEEPVEEDAEPAGPSEDSFPVETAITITKPGQGALTIDAVAQGRPLCPPRRGGARSRAEPTAR